MTIYTGDTGDRAKLDKIKDLNMRVMLSPTSKNFANIPFAIDNGAFSSWTNGYGFDEYGFLKLLHKVRKKK